MPKKTEPKPYAKPDQIQTRANQIYSPVRQKWVQLTPEERVRQDFLLVLINEYGYSLEQIDEETPVTGRGSGHARADFLIWRSPEAKKNQEHALIVVECKADNINISLKDYTQGANYAQYEHARFFVTHNHRETKYWKVDATRRIGQDQDRDPLHRALPVAAETRRAARHRPARGHFQQPLARLCARVLREPRLHPRGGQSAAGDLLLVRRERQSLAPLHAEVHGKGTGRVRRQAGAGARRGDGKLHIEYKMAGVKWYGEGVFHRETVCGNGLSASHITQLVENALIYNRLFAWKASFAVVPS